jgi:hypothetical protein
MNTPDRDPSYYLPDLIVEGVLREAYGVLKRNPGLIDHIFRFMVKSRLVREKYGQKEIERIKQNIEKYDWSFVHSFNEVEGKTPAISIQLMAENEAKEVQLEDFEKDARVPLRPEELAALIVVPSVQPTAYNPLSGALAIPDDIDLTNVHRNLLFVDASGQVWPILGGINETPGQQQFLIAANVAPDLTAPGLIKSAIDFKQITIRGNMTDVNLLLGVHTKDPLLTKYFYIILKYFLMVRKHVLIEEGFICSKFQGSEFTRNLKIEGDAVFNRFLTLSGKVEDSFRSDETQVFDSIDVIIQVPKDVATTEDLGLENAGIQVGPTSQDE